MIISTMFSIHSKSFSLEKINAAKYLCLLFTSVAVIAVSLHFIINVYQLIVIFDADSLDEVDKTYKSIADLGVRLKALREENSRHSQVL